MGTQGTDHQTQLSQLAQLSISRSGVHFYNKGSANGIMPRLRRNGVQTPHSQLFR